MHIQLVSVTMRAHVVCRLNITVSLKVGGCFKYDFLSIFCQHLFVSLTMHAHTVFKLKVGGCRLSQV